MTESATTSPMRGRFDRRFAGGVPWDPCPEGQGVLAGYVGERRWLRQSGREPQVHVVERGGDHTHADLAGSGLGDLHQEETMLGAAARVVELAEGSG